MSTLSVRKLDTWAAKVPRKLLILKDLEMGGMGGRGPRAFRLAEGGSVGVVWRNELVRKMEWTGARYRGVGGVVVRSGNGNEDVLDEDVFDFQGTPTHESYNWTRLGASKTDLAPVVRGRRRRISDVHENGHVHNVVNITENVNILRQ